MHGKTYQGIIRSHFTVGSEGFFMKVKLNAEPLLTAEMVLNIVTLQKKAFHSIDENLVKPA